MYLWFVLKLSNRQWLNETTITIVRGKIHRSYEGEIFGADWLKMERAKGFEPSTFTLAR